MIKKLVLLSLVLSSLAFAQDSIEDSIEVPSFADGSRVACVAASSVGKDDSGLVIKDMDVFYRIDRGQKKPVAYFRKTEIIGNYSYDGMCTRKLCELSIRDLRTNTVSTMNASYAKLNSNSAQIQISNFKEDLTLTFTCSLK